MSFSHLVCAEDRPAPPPIVKDAATQVLLRDFIIIGARASKGDAEAITSHLKKTCALVHVNIFSSSSSVQGCYGPAGTLASFKSCCQRHHQAVRVEAALALEIIKGNISAPIMGRIKSVLESKRLAARGHGYAVEGEKPKILPVTNDDMKTFFEEVKKRMETGKFPGDKQQRTYEQYYKELLEKDLSKSEKEMGLALANLGKYEKTVRNICNQASKEYEEKKNEVVCETPEDMQRHIVEQREKILDTLGGYDEDFLTDTLDRFHFCVVLGMTDGVCKYFTDFEKKSMLANLAELRKLGFCEWPPQDPIICPSNDGTPDKNIDIAGGNELPGSGTGPGRGLQGIGQEQTQGKKGGSENSCAFTQEDAKKYAIRLCRKDEKVCVFKRVTADQTNTPLCSEKQNLLQTGSGSGSGSGQGKVSKCADELKDHQLCSAGGPSSRGSKLLSDMKNSCIQNHQDAGSGSFDKKDAIMQTSKFLMRNLIMSARDQMMQIRFRKGSYKSKDQARQDNMEHYMDWLSDACVDNNELKGQAESMLGPLRQEVRTSNYFQNASDESIRQAAHDLGPLKEIIKQLAQTAADFPEKFVNFESMFLDLVPCGVVIKGLANLVRNEMLQYKNRRKECTDFPKLLSPDETEDLSCEGISNRVMQLADGKFESYGNPKLQTGVNIDSAELDFHDYSKIVNETTTEQERLQGELEGYEEGYKAISELAAKLKQQYLEYQAKGKLALPKNTPYQVFEYDSASGAVQSVWNKTPGPLKASDLANFYQSNQNLMEIQARELLVQAESGKQQVQNAKTKIIDARAEINKIMNKFKKVMPGITVDGRELIPPTVVSPMEPKILQCHRKCQRMHGLLAQKSRILQENPSLARRLVKDKGIWDQLGDFFASSPTKMDEDKLFTHITNDDPKMSEEILDRVLSQTDTAFNQKDGNINLESKGHSVIWDIKSQIRSLCKDPEKFVKAALTNPKMQTLMNDCSIQKDGMPHHQYKGKDIWNHYNEEWSKDCHVTAQNADIQFFVCNNVTESQNSEKTHKDLETALQVGGDMADVVGCALIVGKGISLGAKVIRVGTSFALKNSARAGVRTAIALGVRRGAKAALRVEIPAGINLVGSTVGKVAMVNMGLGLAMATDQQFGILNPDRHRYCHEIARTGLSQGHFDLVPQEDSEKCKAHAEGLIQFTRMAILSYAVGKFDDGSASILKKLAGSGAERLQYERMLLSRYKKLNAKEKAHFADLPSHHQQELKLQILAQLAGKGSRTIRGLNQKSLSELIDLFNQAEGEKYCEANLSPLTRAMDSNDKLFKTSNPLTQKMRNGLGATELLYLGKIESENKTRMGELDADISRLEKIAEKKRTKAEKTFLRQLHDFKKDLIRKRQEYLKRLAENKKGCV